MYVWTEYASEVRFAASAASAHERVCQQCAVLLLMLFLLHFADFIMFLLSSLCALVWWLICLLSMAVAALCCCLRSGGCLRWMLLARSAGWLTTGSGWLVGGPKTQFMKFCSSNSAPGFGGARSQPVCAHSSRNVFLLTNFYTTKNSKFNKYTKNI